MDHTPTSFRSILTVSTLSRHQGMKSLTSQYLFLIPRIPCWILAARAKRPYGLLRTGQQDTQNSRRLSAGPIYTTNTLGISWQDLGIAFPYERFWEVSSYLPVALATISNNTITMHHSCFTGQIQAAVQNHQACLTMYLATPPKRASAFSVFAFFKLLNSLSAASFVNRPPRAVLDANGA